MRLSVRSRAWETIGVAALLCLSAGARTAHAQVAGAIRGKVTDGATQRPLDGVHVTWLEPVSDEQYSAAVSG